MKPWHYLVLAACFLFASCDRKSTTIIGKVAGYKPVYSTETDLYTIQSKPPQQVIHGGKIYVKDNYIFQNEIGEGIHIVNNSNPANAQRVGFIKIKGSEEISIKGNYLYSNNFNDLVVIDISNIAAVTEVKRLKSAFHVGSSNLAPPVTGSYFECVDNSKGTVTGWIRDSLTNPKCRN